MIQVAYYLDYETPFAYSMLRASIKSLLETRMAAEIYLVSSKGMSIPEDIREVVSIHSITLQPGYYTKNKHGGYASLGITGNVLYIDIDTIFNKPVHDVFDDIEFILALPERNIPVKGVEFNSGVVFCRTPELWEELAQANIHYRAMIVESYFSVLARTSKYNVKVIPSSYNWAPRTPYEDVSHAHIVHYKGQRKSWMPIETETK
jgi:hypothetical protein